MVLFSRRVSCFTSAFFFVFTAHEQTLNIVTEQWAPYIQLQKNGKITGPLVDKIKAIMAHADINYNLNIYPWPRTYHKALTEKNTLIFPIFKNKTRITKFHFVCPLSKGVNLYLIKLSRRKDIKITSFADAKKYRFGVIRGDYDHEMLLNEGFKDGDKIDTNINDINNLKKLIKGRIDLMIQTKGSIYGKLQGLGLSKNIIELAYKLAPEYSGKNCLALSKKTSLSVVKKRSTVT